MYINKSRYKMLSRTGPNYAKITYGVYAGTVVKVEDELEVIEHNTAFQTYYEIINKQLIGKTDCGKTIDLTKRGVEWLFNYNGPATYCYTKKEKSTDVSPDILGNIPEIGDCVIHTMSPSKKQKNALKIHVSKLLVISTIYEISKSGCIYVKPIVAMESFPIDKKSFRLSDQFIIIRDNFKDMVLMKKLMANT